MNNYEYKIVEDNELGGFLCCVLGDGIMLGEVHYAPNHESMFAWLRLVMGNYPGMFVPEVA